MSDEITKIDFWFSSISFLVFLATPMVLLLAAFGVMITEIQRIALSTPGRNMGANRRYSLSSSERRSTYIYISMYATFLLLAMPYYSLRLKYDLEMYLTDDNKIEYSELLTRFVVGAKYSTSVIRPVLYMLTSVKPGAVALQLFQKIVKREIHVQSYSEPNN